MAVVAFLNQIGSNATASILGWLVGVGVRTIFALIGFAVGALVVNWVGRAVFKADVTFDELVRTLGLAYVWQVVGVLGVISAFVAALDRVLEPVMFIAAILTIVAWFIAAKEALDLDWVQTIITVFLGWVALILVSYLGSLVLGMLGYGAAALWGLFS